MGVWLNRVIKFYPDNIGSELVVRSSKSESYCWNDNPGIGTNCLKSSKRIMWFRKLTPNY